MLLLHFYKIVYLTLDESGELIGNVMLAAVQEDRPRLVTAEEALEIYSENYVPPDNRYNILEALLQHYQN